MTQDPIQRQVGSVAMKVVNPGNINAQPTADAADHQLREVDVDDVYYYRVMISIS